MTEFNPGGAASLNEAVKLRYEANADTNAFTDAEKTKLSGIAPGATANATDAQLRDRSTHTGAQPISSVTGLQTALDGKAATSHTHTLSQISDAGTAAAADTGDFAAASHGHAISEITSLQTTLDGKAAISHSHIIGDVTGLQTALDGKQAALVSATNIKTVNGISLLGSGDIDVSGGAGSVSWGGIGGTLSNQTDLQTALDGKAASSHGHAIGDVTGLQTALDGKAATSHGHAIADVTNLQTTLDGKAATSHTHTLSQITDAGTAAAADTGDFAAASHSHAISDVTGLQTALDGKAASSHTHSTSQVTGLDAALAAKLESVDIADINATGTADGTTFLRGDGVWGTPAGGGGGITWSTAVDADIVPDADSTRDLGSTGTRFAQAYVDEMFLTEGAILTEAADHPVAPSAGIGQLWVSNDATQRLMFTDDAGTDKEVAFVTGGTDLSAFTGILGLNSGTAVDVNSKALLEARIGGVDLALATGDTYTGTHDFSGATVTLPTGSVGATQLASTAVTPGSYTNADITVDADGRITAAANGSSGGTPSWGSITGTLSSQTDLQNALNAKITAFADPNADRIVFWDDSAGAFAALTAGTGLTISGTTMTPRAASDTQTGIVELATSAETQTGTDTTRAVTPAGLASMVPIIRQAAVEEQTATSYSLLAADSGKTKRHNNAGAVTVTLPANATTALSVGHTSNHLQFGAGTVTIDAAVGVTLNGVSGGAGAIQTRYRGLVTVVKIATDEWIAFGDIAEVA